MEKNLDNFPKIGGKIEYPEKNEKIILIGPSGSGKDYLLNKLSNKGLKPCVKWTTRPPRKNERQGINYNFVDQETFEKSIITGNFISYQKFTLDSDIKKPETWCYGITKEEFNNSQIFIMTPSEFKELTNELKNKCFVVYLDIDRDTRKTRINNRGDKNDSVERRLDADEIDFKGFENYDLRVTDPDFDVDDIYALME